MGQGGKNAGKEISGQRGNPTSNAILLQESQG